MQNLSFFAFGAPGPQELIIILIIVLIFFGTKIPSVMRSMGQGVNEFKKGLKDPGDDDKSDKGPKVSGDGSDDQQKTDDSTSEKQPQDSGTATG